MNDGNFITKEYFESTVLKLQKQFITEMSKVDQRVVDTRKDLEAVKAEFKKQTDSVLSGINGLRNRYDKELDDQRKMRSQALGEIAFLQDSFNEVLA